jgi:glucose-1-phosphate cytidylyltransferase
MQLVILAGGFGTRISEESQLKPKPLIEVGGKPIIWHIMKSYASYGITDFVICCGYKGYLIKEYFANYFLHMSDLTIDLENNDIQYHVNHSEPWKVSLIDTGESTQTGGRLKRVRDFVAGDFCMTYGDGVGSVDVGKLVQFHRDHGKMATLTATQPPGRFGALQMEGSVVKSFLEKPAGDDSWINGGFFVLSEKVFDLIEGDDTIWEREPLEKLAQSSQLEAFFHDGFWQPMDTLRDKTLLEELWDNGNAPWKNW